MCLTLTDKVLRFKICGRSISAGKKCQFQADKDTINNNRQESKQMNNPHKKYSKTIILC